MKEWFVYFWYPGDDPVTAENLVIFSSRWKLLKWLLANAHRCIGIYIRLFIDGVHAR